MKSVFRATAILSGSSVISILLSLVSAKVMALYLQPAGYGYYGLLQSFVSVAGLIAGMGVATAIVRLGAGAVTRQDDATVASLRSASWLLFAGLGAATLILLALFRHLLKTPPPSDLRCAVPRRGAPRIGPGARRGRGGGP
jgi:PST family polysaccharide transporter